VKRIHALAKQYPRYGYRRIHALLVREGWRVNRKRVQRLWRAEGLKVVRRQRKRRRLGSSENGSFAIVPSTRTTCGATTSRWIRRQTAGV
jgi:transposase InsO family protein